MKNQNISMILTSLKKVYSDLTYTVLTLSLGINILLVYYLVFLKTTTFEVFFSSNIPFYNWSSIFLTLLNSILFGIAISFVLYSYRQKTLDSSSSSNSFFGAVFGAISTGCPVCGAYLLPLLGIAGSLAAFPLQGLEIKILSVFLLIYAVFESSKTISGVCSVPKNKLFSQTKKDFIININKQTLPQAKPFAILIVLISVVYTLPLLPSKYKLSFSAQSSLISNTQNKSEGFSNANTAKLYALVNPKEGYTVNATFGDIGPRLIEEGAIDLEKFEKLYEKSGVPLTEAQMKILTEGSNENIKIDKENAYFLINFLWATGLANKNVILDEGDMTKYGESRIGSFASTGGWTLGKKPATEIYSNANLINLTAQQQSIVDEAANGTYRPCCGNSTAFPDCNHGMAMLGLYELMASQGASVDELFEAGKYFNAFWFPQQTLDIATYFKARENKDFDEIDPKIVVSNEFSSGGGWSKTKRWLADNNLVEKAPSGGGGCGV